MRTNKIVTAITAVIMAGVLAAGVCCLGFASRGNDGKWFGNFKDISGWHWSDDKPNTDNPELPDNPDDKTDTDDRFDGNGSNTEVSEVESKGVRLMSARIAPEDYEEYGIAPQAEDAYTITATVKDEDGGIHDYLQDVSYSVAWASASSDNLSDYITYSVDGAKITFYITGAFATQIRITCTSNIESTVSASATVNYRRRLQSYKVTLAGTEETIREGFSGSGFINFTMPDCSVGVSTAIYNTENLTFVSGYTYGRGTKDCSINMLTIDVKATDTFKAACAGNSYLTCGGTLSMRGSTIYKKSLVDLFHTVVGSSCISYQSARYALFRALASTDNQFNVTGTISTNVGSYSFSYTINVIATAPVPSTITFDKINFDI